MIYKRSRMRIVIYAPYFVEYSLRLAVSLAAHAKVLLVVDQRSRENEISPDLLLSARKSVRVMEFRRYPVTRFDRFVVLVWIPLCIRLFFPHIVHVQEYGDAITAAAVHRLRKRVPVVLTVHDPQPHTGSDSDWFRQAWPHLDRMRDDADGLHVHGPYCEALLRRTRDVRRPVLSTPHGVLFVPANGSLSHRRPGRMLFFGRMEAYKGLGVFLDALEVLRGRGQPFEAVIAGAGPELDARADSIALHPDIEVRNGFLLPATVIDLFQSCCFVVMPYMDATQSGILAAAFGNGRPVVATRVGGLVDMVDDGINGLLIPPNSPEGLADACQRLLLSSETADSLAQGAALRSQTDMSWAAIAGDLAAFYRELIDRQKS